MLAGRYVRLCCSATCLGRIGKSTGSVVVSHFDFGLPDGAQQAIVSVVESEYGRHHDVVIRSGISQKWALGGVAKTMDQLSDVASL